MSQLVRALSCNQKIAGSIPGQDTYLSCGFSPWSRARMIPSPGMCDPCSGCAWEAINWCFSLIDVSVSPFLCLWKAMKKCPCVRIKKILIHVSSVWNLSKVSCFSESFSFNRPFDQLEVGGKALYWQIYQALLQMEPITIETWQSHGRLKSTHFLICFFKNKLDKASMVM